MARIIVGAGEEGRPHPIRGTVVIGRSSEVSLPVADGKLSREHCRISFDGKFYLLEDLGSKNGTFLNNRRLKSATPLRSGDEIRIGGTVLAFELEFGDAVPPAEDSVDARVAFQKPSTARPGRRGGPGPVLRLLAWLFLAAVLAGGAWGSKHLFVWALRVVVP